MNKFCENQGTLFGDLDYAKRLEDVKKKLAEQMRQEFSFVDRIREPIIIKNDRFSAHPRICSGSDTTISNSPRNNISLSSTKANRMIPGDYRKNPYKKWTNSTQHLTVPDRIDLNIGDSYQNIPINSTTVDNIKEELKMFCNKFEQKTSPIRNTQSRTEDPQKNNIIKVMSEATFEKKFKTFVEKSVQTISDIRDLIDKGIEPPDGDEDLSRRKLRVTEFSNRFSRNYLYPLVRQIDELSKWRSIHQNSNQKLLSAYQVIYNGLQAYQNHIPTSIGDCSSDKLKLLMKHLLDICDIHYKLLPESDENSYKDFILTFRLHAEMTLKKIEDHFNTNFTGPSGTIRMNAPQFRSESKIVKQKKPTNNMQERFYMYNTTSSFRKKPIWRMTAEALDREKKKKIQSRYKTAGFKHRPPIIRAKEEISSVSESQTKLSNKKSLGIFKKHSAHAQFNEDEIATMIQMEDERDKSDGDEEKQDVNKQAPVNIEEIVLKLLQLVIDINARNKDNNSEENIKRNRDVEKIMDILEKMKQGADFESLKDVLKDIQSCRETLDLKIVTSSERFLNIFKKQKKEPTVTVTGAKNAKLICIQDNDSVTETDVKDDNEPEKAVAVKTASSHQSATKNAQLPSTSFSVKKSSKSSKYLQMLPKDYAVNIIQYKIDFGKHCKSNPMYKKNAKVLPWVMMANLSEEILKLVLLEVTKEVEITEVIEKIYQSELQFC